MDASGAGIGKQVNGRRWMEPTGRARRIDSEKSAEGEVGEEKKKRLSWVRLGPGSWVLGQG